MEALDIDDAKSHKVLASKMDIKDIMDILTPYLVVHVASREETMLGMETDVDGDHDHNSPR